MLRLLIYIPCYSDYQIARDSIKNLHEQIKNNINTNELSIIFSISVNGVALSGEDISEFKDLVNDFTYYPTSIGGDTNILRGYLKALEIKPDYFLILSANEIITKNYLVYLNKMLIEYSNIDIFIANSGGTNANLKIKNLFLDLPSESAVGRISAVIYKFSTTHKYFSIAQKFNWTGWGQLAVIQNVLTNKEDCLIHEFPESEIYSPPNIYFDSTHSTQKEFIKFYYHDSFFSHPILAAYFMRNNKKEFKKYYRNFLKTNWHKMNFFHISNSEKFNSIEQLDPVWVEKQFLRAIKPFSRLLYLLSMLLMVIPTFNFKNTNLIVSLREKYSR